MSAGVYDLRCGRYQQVLPDVEVDATIADPPFGERTHEGASHDRLIEAADGANREAVEYDFWTPADVHEFVTFWHERTRFWMGSMTSHDLIPAWEDAYASVGRYHFAPVPICCTNPGARVGADGPASGTVYLMVARPKTSLAAAWRSLPPHYFYTRTKGEGGGGRDKSVPLMARIICDYSNPGHTICDPTCGRGSTLEAAIRKGRYVYGAEMLPDVYERAQARLARVVQGPRDMFDPRTAKPGILL